ncbi:MAG: O-antigen ligase family protein [Kiritimatiellae bacterium]|nr:O-antigen ligase family protein [Kiritimatiellia bacterium]
MSFLYNNAAVLAVGATVSAVAWLFGGARGELLLPVVPWLFAMMLEIIICYPQRHRGETTYDARERVWKELRRSPVVWLVFAFMLLMAIPFTNNGLCPVCDATKIEQGFKAAPPLPYLPFCVNRLDHLEVVMWFMTALFTLIAVRHSLTRRGKRMVLQLIVWNGVALAVLGFVQGALGAPGPFWTDLAKEGNGGAVYFFSSFGYPNMAGDYFTTLFGIAVALWRDQYEHMRKEDKAKDISDRSGREARPYNMFWRRHYYLIPAALFFFAALNTLSRSAIVLVTALSVVYFLHTLVTFLHRMSRSRRVYVGVWSMVVFGLLVFFATIAMPGKIRKEVDSLQTNESLNRITGKEHKQIRAAVRLWKMHPVFGCGGWGYAHFCTTVLTPDERRVFQKQGGINVHNDYVQFLAEHGAVGFALLIAMVVATLWPVCRQWRMMVNAARFKKGADAPPHPVLLFVIPSPVLFIMLAAVATLVHAFADCPFRSCAVLSLFFTSLAALPGFMPEDYTVVDR